jgi:SAM-dependent methyltransferase
MCKAVLDSHADLIAEYALVDISEAMIGFSKERLKFYSQESHKLKLSFYVLSADELQSISDDYYDIVVSNYCIHLVGDLQKALKEIKRILKPEGYLASSVQGDINRSPRYQLVIDLAKSNGLFEEKAAWFKSFYLGEVKLLSGAGEGAGLRFIEGHEFFDLYRLTSDFARSNIDSFKPVLKPDIDEQSLEEIVSQYQARVDEECKDGLVKSLGIFVLFQK